MVSIHRLEFRFPHSNFRLDVPSLEIEAGERVAIVGPSGSGKTTLLHLIAEILPVKHGVIRVDGRPLSGLSDVERRAFRLSRVGLVFQSFELVSYLDVLENVLLPYRLNSALRLSPETSRRAVQFAEETGIGQRLRYLPHRLSQGEKQRAAICRAMLVEPPLLLADEPTGNLDPAAKQRIVDLLFTQVERTRSTLIMVTHDTEIAARFPRVINCRDFGGTIEQ